MADANIPEGWYPDPSKDGQHRYWDGQGWTHNTKPSVNDVPTDQPTNKLADAPADAPAARGGLFNSSLKSLQGASQPEDIGKPARKQNAGELIEDQISTEIEQSKTLDKSFRSEDINHLSASPNPNQRVEQAAERQSNKLQTIWGIVAIFLTIAAVPILKSGDINGPSEGGCFTQEVTAAAVLAAVIVMAAWGGWFVVSISRNLRLADFYGAKRFLILSGIGSMLFTALVYGIFVLLRVADLIFVFGLPAMIGLLLYMIGLVSLLIKVASKQPLGQQPAKHLVLTSLSQGLVALVLSAYGPLLQLGVSILSC